MPEPLHNREQTLAHLEQAERHVREGSGRVEKLVAVLEGLQSGGHPTETAEMLLAKFREIVAAQIESRDRLREEARGPA